MPKQKMNCQDLSDRVQSVMETIQDNDMIDCTGAVYVKNDTELSWPIKLGAICAKN